VTDRRRLDTLLDRALELPAAERRAFLDREAASEDERQTLARLLAAAEDSAAEPRLGGALWSDLADGFARELATGERLGAYRILGELGRGGMATVYRAERADRQYEQTVALKILDRPAADARAVARFNRERQILASLDHPRIARILDGGVAPDGRPWFAMELVDGARIDEHCDHHRLDLRRRLALFAEVAQAVAAAHRQLVVHRDIKPSNILVDALGQPKLLDFGIAKLVEEEVAEGTAGELTHAAVPLTPSYASPEQAGGLPVTTASDVYQLGLLLYELLAGERAFPPSEATPASLRERASVGAPCRPSETVSGAPGAARAEGRGLGSARQLRRALAGDLDTIVLTALRPEVGRRYPSVERLIEDVERHLGGLPILARRDALAYRAGKFVSRHRFGVAAATVGVVALVAVVGYYTARLRTERDTAARQAATARQVAQFLADLFTAADPFTVKQVAQRTAVELLAEGTRLAEHGGALTTEPEARAALLAVLGNVYGGLGEMVTAIRLSDEAIALRRERLGPLHPDTLDGRLDRMSLERLAGRPTEAQVIGRELLPLLEAALGPGHPRVGDAKMQLALALADTGPLEEARALIAGAVAIAEVQRPADPLRLARVLTVEATIAGRSGDLEASAELSQRAVDLVQSVDPDNPTIANTLGGLAGDLQNLGRVSEARAALAEAERILLARAGAEHPLTLKSSLRIANLAVLLGEPAVALTRLDATLPIADRVLGPTSWWLGYGRLRRAMALVDLGRKDEAAAEALRGRDLTVAALGETSATAIDANRRLGGVLQDVGRFAEAKDVLRHTIQLAEANLPAGNLVVPNTLMQLADVELALGDAAGAKPVIARVIELQAALWPKGHVDQVRGFASQAEILVRLGDRAAARTTLDRALALTATVEGVTPELRARLDRLAAALAS
jgi:serine/threonine-protein kinase